MSQDALFDVEAPGSLDTEKVDKRTREPTGLALCYTVTFTGKHSGIRFAMSVEHAKQWCQSNKSKGVMHGHQWMYMWTTVENAVYSAWGTGIINLDGLEDSGKWDEPIKQLGLTKISLTEFRDVFPKLGIKVIGEPRNTNGKQL